jgi:hypothetical protein
MKQFYRKRKVFFRFVDFPERLLPELKGTLPNTELEVKKTRTSQKLVVSFELTKHISKAKLVLFMRRKNISPNKCGLWVSLVTDCDSDGVHVPAFAVKLLRETGGQLDFSFTLV